MWGVDPDILPGKGVPAVELLDTLGHRRLRALLVHGTNPVVSAPDATAVRRRLAALDLLVVCDSCPCETAVLADVVLPVTQWAEEEGTMTNLEGRVLRRRRPSTPPGGVRSELDVLADLAARLGAPVHVDDATRRAVFDELGPRQRRRPRRLRRHSATTRLDDEQALFWPCPVRPTSAPRGCSPTRSRTPTAGPGWSPVERGGPADDLRADAPVYLVTGRVLAQYQSGAQTRRVRR